MFKIELRSRSFPSSVSARWPCVNGKRSRSLRSSTRTSLKAHDRRTATSADDRPAIHHHHQRSDARRHLQQQHLHQQLGQQRSTAVCSARELWRRPRGRFRCSYCHSVRLYITCVLRTMDWYTLWTKTVIHVPRTAYSFSSFFRYSRCQ